MSRMTASTEEMDGSNGQQDKGAEQVMVCVFLSHKDTLEDVLNLSPEQKGIEDMTPTQTSG